MLDLAKRQLRDLLHALRPALRDGVPIVGLEPSCVSVFRDELVNLYPEREDARRLSRQTLLLSELLARDDVPLPSLSRAAVVQNHCHQHAVLDAGAARSALERMHADYRVLDSGCCGMAGAFGFERGEHCDVSLAAGERSLFPAIRNLAADAMVLADGFSCREQIRQGTGRTAVHFAEALWQAIETEDRTRRAPTSAPR